MNKVNVEYEEVLNCVEGLIQSTDCNGIIYMFYFIASIIYCLTNLTFLFCFLTI